MSDNQQIPTDEKWCDAVHEAGHAVVGVVRGLKLLSAKGVRDFDDPQCKWDVAEFLEKSGNDEYSGFLNNFTLNYAIMCLASEAAESKVCTCMSKQQLQAFDFDYLEAQYFRRNTLGKFFYTDRVAWLKERARCCIDSNWDAVKAVAEALRSTQLNHEDVRKLIVAQKTPASDDCLRDPPYGLKFS